MELERVREYVRLKRREAELDAQLKSVKEELLGLQDVLLEAFAQESVSSIAVDGMTAYMHRQLWAGPADGVSRDQLVEHLKAASLEHFVHETYNVNTLSSFVRDLEREEADLPEELEDVLATREVYSIRVRRTA